MASLSHRLFRGRISIHALREEGDWIWCASWGLFLQFLSTPSARRATAGRRNVRRLVGVFLSTPSARRATHVFQPVDYPDPISIHALREEGDLPFLRQSI